MPQPLPKTKRYINPEATTVYLIKEVEDLDAITREEIDAATSIDLTGEIESMTGWEISTDRVSVPDLGSKKTGKIAGRVNPGDAQITFYGDESTVDVRDAIERGDRCVIVILDGGDVPGRKMRPFETSVSGVTPTTDVKGADPVRVVIDFAIEDWAEGAEVPAVVTGG